MNKQENKNEGNNNKVKEVKHSFLDFICPICLEILIEPVQMPCQHELCMNCFQMHVYNTSLTCPMCRLRISTWARINTKNKTLVNVNRWKLIKESFPDRVKSRLENKEYVEEVVVAAPIHIIAQDGDIRKEYEEQRRQFEAEQNEVAAEDLSYVFQIHEMENKEREKQLELDLQQAQKLQMEEMKGLGVTLKSPSRYQQDVLDRFRPKSPMRLRSSGVKRKSSLSTTQTKSFFPTTSTKTLQANSSKSASQMSSSKTSHTKVRPDGETDKNISPAYSPVTKNTSFFQATSMSLRKSASITSKKNVLKNAKKVCDIDYELSYQIQAEINGIKRPSISTLDDYEGGCNDKQNNKTSPPKNTSSSNTSHTKVKSDNIKDKKSTTTSNKESSKLKDRLSKKSLNSDKTKLKQLSINDSLQPLKRYSKKKYPFRDMKNMDSQDDFHIKMNAAKVVVLVDDENSPVY